MQEKNGNNKSAFTNENQTTVVTTEENSFKTIVKQVCKWVYRLRSILLAIPVAVTAAILAVRNMAKLPVKVGFDMQASGEFAYLVSRNVAVLGPLAVTAVCLLLMFCSKRVVYPWLISLFSLLLPLVILLVNTFPG